MRSVSTSVGDLKTNVFQRRCRRGHLLHPPTKVTNPATRDRGDGAAAAPGPVRIRDWERARRRRAHRARGGAGWRRAHDDAPSPSAGALPSHGLVRGDPTAHRAAHCVRVQHHGPGRPAGEHATVLEVPAAQVPAAGLPRGRQVRGLRPRGFALPKVQRRRQEAPPADARAGRGGTRGTGTRGRSAPDGLRGDAGSVVGRAMAITGTRHRRRGRTRRKDGSRGGSRARSLPSRRGRSRAAARG